MTRAVKIIAIIVISIAFGFLVTHVGMALMNTNAQEYGTYFGTHGDGLAYYPLTILFAGLGLSIWLDKWFGTEILPH
ncbi:MAG: hypothetical protein ACI9EW_000856 [Cellvibrionaceae bacterium]|jgi:hypothetical protein